VQPNYYKLCFPKRSVDTLASNPNTANLFTPGTPVDPVPTGDVERQAVASLRGYAYQVVAAALAWIDLDSGGRVYLEVAEDYATVAQHALDAVQVKDTAESGSITLNTQAVRDAIDAFVTLVANNKNRNVQLTYFTTSPIGKEQRIADRPAGEAGLSYWRKAAAGADVAPLRTVLTSDKFSAEVRAFVTSRDDGALRRDLLHRIHWECGKLDISGIVLELEERLVVLGREKFGLAATESRQLANGLVYQVLKKSVLKNATERVLTQADLYTTIDAATRVSVSRKTVGSMLDISSAVTAILSGGESVAAALSAVETSWLIPGADFPTPRGIISRQSLMATVGQAFAKYGQAILVGGSGLGKSLLAREVAGKLAAGFATIDLRDVDGGEARRRLTLALGQIGTLDFDCLVFDDFNQIEEPKARASFGRCMQALRRRDRTAIVTVYRRPSHRTLTELGLDDNAVIDIPYLTEEEASQIVEAAGGDSEYWGRIAFASGAQGHPQLVHAFVMGVSARGWPQSEVPEIVIRGFASNDTDAERDAARRSMIASLPDEARALIYRLSLVIGRFNRALALKIAEIPPPLQRAGELLDRLVGPGIEDVGNEGLRVSPLAANAGRGMLTSEEQEAIHAAIALQMLRKSSISATEANGILMHGLFGKNELVLARLAFSAVTAKVETIDQLRDQFFMLPLLRTDALIFSANPIISILLRLAQFRLVASGNDIKATATCAAALMREVSEERDEQLYDLLENLALGSILNTIGIASAVTNWIDLLQRFKAKAESSSILRNVEMATEEERAGRSLLGVMFSIGTANLRSVQRLEEIFIDLDRLSDADRAYWFESSERHPADYGLLVNPSWVAEAKRNELNPANAAERFKRMALMAEKWSLKSLAVECYVARAVMFDEYANDERGALAAMDEAEAALGSNVGISRARARIYWRNHEYHDALRILRSIADEVGRNSSIDRAFAMREASISAAKTGDWAQAAIWFGEADNAAAASGTDEMQIMAVGLEADRAVAYLESANVEEALRAMASCLKRLSKLDPSASLRAGYCHRVARHTILWMDSKIDNRETLIDGTPIQMLPGTCSNPEPPASILDLPLSPLDMAWYMLAEAEASSTGNAGIVESLNSRLRDGPIPFMEAGLRNRQITTDVLSSNTTGFARHFIPYIAGLEYVRRQGESGRESFDALNPPRGEIPILSDEELAGPVPANLAADALVAFGLASLFQGAPDPSLDLQRKIARHVGENFPGKVILERWRRAVGEPTDLDETVVEGIVQLRSGEYLTPLQSWEIGLRFFEKARQSNFRSALVPLLQRWIREQWKETVENGSFRLSRPLQTVPAIEESLARDCKDEAFISSLLLAGAEAVGSTLAPPYEAQLREIANGTR
jgi:hypothetical protein